MTSNEWKVTFYQTMGWIPEPGLLKDAALDAFKREHKAATDQLWELKKLRGADSDGTLTQQIAEIEDTLKRANDRANAGKDAAEIDNARAMLKGIEAKALAAEEKAKTLDQEFNKDIESMPKYLTTLEAARKGRDSIAALPGTKTQLLAIEKLLADGQAKVSKNGSVTRGYAAGLEELVNHGAILEQARKASQEYVKKEIPSEAKKAYDAAQTELKEYRKVGPEFQAELYDKELSDTLNLALEDEGKAVTAIGKIANIIEREAGEQTKLRDTAQKEFKALSELLDKALKKGVPESSLNHALEKQQQAKDFLADSEREYQRAIELIEECDAICASAATDYKKGGVEWKANAGKIPELKARCAQLAEWPPLMSRAQSLLNDTIALEADVAKTRNYTDASQKFDKLEERKTALEDAARKSGMPDDVKKAKKLVEGASKEVWALCEKVRKKFEELEGKMAGVKNPGGTPYHARLTQCMDAWNDFARTPTAETIKKLDKQKKSTLEELDKIQTAVKDLLKNPAELQKKTNDAKAAEEQQAESERPKRIQDMLSELKKLNVDVSQEQSEADKIVTEGLDPGWGRVKTLEEGLEAKLTKAKEERAEKQKKATVTVKRIQAALEVFKSNDRGFETYIEQLKTQADDLQALVDSGDPYLHEQAVKQSDVLVRRMEAIDPDRRPKGAKTFQDVEKKWTELSNQLGKGNLIMNRLPDTYADLRDKLNAALVVARASDPDAGLQALEPLSKPISDARAKTEKEDFNYKAFQEYKKLVEARWHEITKLTRTSVTDRTKSYEAKFKTRVAEAAKLTEEEGKINEAIRKLGEIKDDLEKIASAPNQRKALQDEDAAAGREQVLVTDMARQFEAALGVYRKTTLGEVRKALKGVKGADVDQLDSLEKVPDQAARIVEPYLNILSKLPHKSLAANSAPPMDKAKGDFAKAHKMLADATRTANWLGDNPSGTNVKLTGELERVAQDWVKYATAYAAGVKGLGEVINGEGEKEAEADLKQKSEKLATILLRKTTKTFDPKAFAKPFGVLLKKDATDDDKTQNAKRAARETALRQVRRYKRQLLAQPLLVKINTKDNPFKPIIRQASMLRATLKRLELELLGAV